MFSTRRPPNAERGFRALRTLDDMDLTVARSYAAPLLVFCAGARYCSEGAPSGADSG
jgi:hypothetical protein